MLRSLLSGAAEAQLQVWSCAELALASFDYLMRTHSVWTAAGLLACKPEGASSAGQVPGIADRPEYLIRKVFVLLKKEAAPEIGHLQATRVRVSDCRTMKTSRARTEIRILHTGNSTVSKPTSPGSNRQGWTLHC